MINLNTLQLTPGKINNPLIVVNDAGKVYISYPDIDDNRFTGILGNTWDDIALFIYKTESAATTIRKNIEHDPPYDVPVGIVNQYYEREFRKVAEALGMKPIRKNQLQDEESAVSSSTFKRLKHLGFI